MAVPASSALAPATTPWLASPGRAPATPHTGTTNTDSSTTTVSIINITTTTVNSRATTTQYQYHNHHEQHEYHHCQLQHHHHPDRHNRNRHHPDRHNHNSRSPSFSLPPLPDFSSLCHSLSLPLSRPQALPRAKSVSACGRGGSSWKVGVRLCMGAKWVRGPRDTSNENGNTCFPHR
jgi:hypothetical protein